MNDCRARHEAQWKSKSMTDEKEGGNGVCGNECEYYVSVR